MRDTIFEVLEVVHHKGGIVVFDDKLDSHRKSLDPFLMKGRHEEVDACYLSQSSLDLSKTSKKNNSNEKVFKEKFQRWVEQLQRHCKDLRIEL